jgi:hypothetical protein
MEGLFSRRFPVNLHPWDCLPRRGSESFFSGFSLFFDAVSVVV